MNDIDKIKELLFGHEKKALDAITRRLETPEIRAADVSDILPEAVARSHRRDDRLARSLAEPIEQGLKDAIRRNPAEIADALFPVMGPAIRKAIAESLKAMVQAFNRALDSSLSPRVRFAAWRAGVPLGEYVLQRNLLYRVEQAYLIKRENGLLVASAFHDSVTAGKDEDAVSAMFTAIQDFVKDSFSQDHTGSLETADMGSYTLWAVHGPEAVLVCVIRGLPPLALRGELSAVLERIHLRFSDALADYCGDRDSVAGVELELEPCLALESHRPESTGDRVVTPAVIVVLLALLAGMAWLLYARFVDMRELETLRVALAGAEGIVATRLERVDGRIVAAGLADPLAEPVGEVIRAAGVDPAGVDLDFAGFQSLEPGLIQTRVRTVLRPPPGVSLSVADGLVVARGAASAEWVSEAMMLTRALPGIRGFDGSGLGVADEALLAAVRQAIDPPDTVRVAVSEGRLSVAGEAPAEWITRLSGRLTGIAGLRSVQTGNLVAAERAELVALAGRLDGMDLYFSEGSRLLEADAARLASLAPALSRFGAVATSLGATPVIVLTGHADGTGTPELNAALMLARSQAVADALRSQGIPMDWLAGARGPDRSPGPVDIGSRRVRLTVSARTADGRDLAKK